MLELELRVRGGVFSLFWGLLISVYQICKTGTHTSGAKVPSQVLADQGSNPGVFVFSVQERSDQPDLI